MNDSARAQQEARRAKDVKAGMRTGAKRLTPAAVLAGAILIAACGSTSPSRSSSTSASGGVSANSTQAQIHNESLAFSRCVRTNRVSNFPDPPTNGGYGLQSFAQQSNGETLSINGVSVNEPAFRSAMARCHRYLPHAPAPTTAAVRSSSSGGGSPYEQARAFAECVRNHGVPLWPEPQSSGRFDKSKLTPQQVGAGSSQIAAAERACKSLLPTHFATGQQSHVVAQALRFSRCMRGHGATNFPDPQSSGAIVIPHAMENSPAYLAALNFCVHKYGVPPPPN